MAKGQIWAKKNNVWLPTIHRAGEESDYRWVSSPWSECSVICGGGTQERTVWCENITNGQIVDDSLCQLAWGNKPIRMQECNTHVCTECKYDTTAAGRSEYYIEKSTVYIFWEGTLITSWYQNPVPGGVTRVVGNYRYEMKEQMYPIPVNQFSNYTRYRICRVQIS